MTQEAGLAVAAPTGARPEVTSRWHQMRSFPACLACLLLAMCVLGRLSAWAAR